MSKIIVVGSTNTDLVIKANTFPSCGETINGGTFFMSGGGKGANQAVAVSRLGADVMFITKVGDDIFGREALKILSKETIDIKHVYVDKDTHSGVALIMVNSNGENIISVAPGANNNLLISDIDFVKEFKEAELILLQLEIPISTVKKVIEKARANNQKVILNPAPACPIEDELLNGLFIITPNEIEASMLTGISINDEKSAFDASSVFLKKGVKNVIITLGNKGAFLRSDLHSKLIPPFRVEAKDSTAAGDVFNGALAVAIAEGKKIDDAVLFANKAASISVTRLGAQSSIPYRKELV